jgi:hypothetical protein
LELAGLEGVELDDAELDGVGLVLVLGAPVGLELTVTCGLPVVEFGVPLFFPATANAAVVATATSARDVADRTIRLRMARFLPRIRAAAGPTVWTACDARSRASENVVSKSLDTARSPFD